MTGIGSGSILNYDLNEAAGEVKKENERVSKLLGINTAARCTTVKPSGTSSCVLGSSSGIHAWHNDFYIRRQRIGKNEALYKYFSENHPELVEDEYFNPQSQAVIEIPQMAPEGSILRTESPVELLDRVRRFNTEWVAGGHIEGQNSHNVSCTISVRDGEWALVGEWMWKNRNTFNGISVLPYDGGTYIQAPFEDITEEKYLMMESSLTAINLEDIVESEDDTDLSAEAACAGGACEITF
jgi:ribonucleoside-diphosphate reductase alpha chain